MSLLSSVAEVWYLARLQGRGGAVSWWCARRLLSGPPPVSRNGCRPLPGTNHPRSGDRCGNSPDLNSRAVTGGVASASNTNWPELPDFQSAASSARIGPAALPTPQHNYHKSYIVCQIILLKLLQKAPKPQTLSIGPFQWTRDSSQWMSFKRKWASVELLRKEEISYRDQNYFL